MVNNAAYPVRCAVKIGWENGVCKSLVHSSKAVIYFGFRIFDFGFFIDLNIECDLELMNHEVIELITL